MHIYHEETFPLKLLIESSNLIDIDEFIIIITRRRNVFRSQLWNVFSSAFALIWDSRHEKS